MKRYQVFPVFFIFSVLFACQIPTAIEVRGTPELRFSSKMDIGNMFAQELEDGFNDSDFTLMRCTNPANITYIVHSDLFDEAIDINNTPEGHDFEESDYDYPLVGQRNLVNPSKPKILPLSGLGKLLNGFAFNNSKTFLYMSGNDVVERLWLGIKVDGGEEQAIEIKHNIPSNRDNWGNEYAAVTVPPDGHPVNLRLDGNDVNVDYRIYGEDGTTFSKKDFDGACIRVEFVIWLPMEFVAVKNDAEFSFPSIFFGEGDLFGRESPDAESVAADVIESLSMIIKLNTNPFLGKNLVVSGGNSIEIREYIKTNSLNYAFNEENMALINDPVNWPFVPTLKVVFNYGDFLKFPRAFNAVEVIFSARIKFMIDLQDSSGEKGEKGESGETDESGGSDEPGEPGEPNEPGEPGEPEETGEG